MAGLLLVGFVAGVIAGVSPCILPILPIVLVGWTAPTTAGPATSQRRRSFAVMAGLVVSFGVITAVGSLVLSALGLPQNLLRDLGIFLLVLFGVSLLSTRIEMLFERPFRRFVGTQPSGTGSGFVLGLGLGTVFVPCAGPVLATVSVLGATHRASFYSVLLSLVFAAGAALPLFTIALVGDRFVSKSRRLSSRVARLRPVAGVLLILMALTVALNLTAPLQRWIPGYTAALQQKVEGNSYVTHALRSLSPTSTSNGSLTACEATASLSAVSTLQQCGTAPALVGITNWLNTPGGRALQLSSLRGHVVLIDFWTYSCINCQRALPHVEAWYAKYHRDGLDVIGVQAPEFAFEHVVSNIRQAAKSLGVVYPIAVDNNLATWTAYQNNYWPAQYLIDANGVIRHVDYGEGNYGGSESLIRALLLAAHPNLVLPRPTDVPDLTPTQALSPETYLGSERSQYLQGRATVTNGTSSYTFPGTLMPENYALSGVWTTSGQSITSGKNGALELSFQATHVYLVLGGTGTVRETLNGKYLATVKVRGFPTLYQLVSQSADRAGVLELQFSPGVAAYDFTFG